MIMIYLALVVAVLGFNIFNLTTRLQTINRVVINTPKEIFESSIPLIEYNEKNDLYFDKNLLETNLKNYYDRTLKGQCKSYLLSLYFYNSLDHSFCDSDKCQSVEVEINANVIWDVNCTRTYFYQIQKN